MVTHDLGESDTAEPMFRRAVTLNQKVLGAEHPETIDTLNALGFFLMETERDQTDIAARTNTMPRAKPAICAHRSISDICIVLFLLECDYAAVSGRV